MARSAYVVGAILSLVLGCGASEDHPPPAGDVVGEYVQPSNGDDQLARSRLQTEPCEPGSSRPCHRYFYDDQGQLHCPLEDAYCRNDGLGYYACGMYGRDADGGLVPRFADAGIAPR